MARSSPGSPSSTSRGAIELDGADEAKVREGVASLALGTEIHSAARSRAFPIGVKPARACDMRKLLHAVYSVAKHRRPFVPEVASGTA
jgi:hypothetical protein